MGEKFWKYKHFVNLEEFEVIWRPLSTEERTRAENLMELVIGILEVKAHEKGMDLYQIADPLVKSVVYDVVARTLMTSTNQEPMTQMSQSAGGYSVSGTFLVPGGGLFIKKSELARLGLLRQKCGVIDPYGISD